MNILRKNMKLLIDSNVLIDVLQVREPFYEKSSEVMKICERFQAYGYISSLTFANMVYVMRNEFTAERIEETAYGLYRVLTFVDLSFVDILRAARMRWDDFEDALQSVAAERVKADYIITRNIKDFEKSLVKALTPEDFLNLNFNIK